MAHGEAKAAPVTGTTLRITGPVPADSRQRTPPVRNCVARYPYSQRSHRNILIIEEV